MEMSDAVVMGWINTGNRRYYRALLQPDLFGDWTLMRSWGSLDNARGQVHIEPVSDPAAGKQAIAAIHKRRLAHGYLPLPDRPT